jgi:hypothetical protein
MEQACAGRGNARFCPGDAAVAGDERLRYRLFFQRQDRGWDDANHSGGRRDPCPAHDAPPKTRSGRAAYALRKQTVKPLFGNIETVMGFRRLPTRESDDVRETNGPRSAWHVISNA